ncbi:BTAD domain-containing putative transcriptional regulator [Actinoalloteichus sp. AHMU CJ021]|uniref:BTAD domain-containing putative transcriptional regulator n=1 Tax=Actinoalloteichus sp. AHMU CJ021 TaxID=2072503 RepID=UPI0003735CA0
MLALLAARAARTVELDELVEELWASRVPRSARTTVQTYVLQLRRLLATAISKSGFSPSRADSEAKRLLETCPGGYVLNVAPEEVDVWHFERLAAEGHRARETGDPQLAATRFAEALGWWRGSPLSGVPTGRHLREVARRWEEMRLNVLDRRIDADLLLGRHHELVGELTALVLRHPRHEGLCAHLMVALYRSGRSCEALEVYRRLRAGLSDESGIEPSPQLRRLHRSMLVPDRAREDMGGPGRRAVPVGGRSTEPATARGRGDLPERISAETAALPWDAHGRISGTRPAPSGLP